jgi:hypothetical protein
MAVRNWVSRSHFSPHGKRIIGSKRRWSVWLFAIGWLVLCFERPRYISNNVKWGNVMLEYIRVMLLPLLLLLLLLGRGSAGVAYRLGIHPTTII